EEFQNEVWAVYPRQEKFGDAWNAYYRATVTGANPAGKATKSQIIQGIGNYKRYLEVKGIQGQYVQQLANWLDNGGWLSNYDMTPPVQPAATSGGQASREAQTYVRNDF
ncbi:DNA replication protein DnaD, partial [Lactiplantibacillus plantarum]|nr:DNA replication protein DnaD [Lactiplantibacillus plantarum]